MRLLTHILRQWAGVNAYVANTTVQDQAFDDVLNTSTETGATRFGTAVERVQQDLMVFLHQSVKQGYLAGDPSNLVWPIVAMKPDYRVQQRPVVRWTFNNGGSPFPDAEGSSNSFTATNVALSGGKIVETGNAGTCQSSQPVDLSDGFGNNRFAVAFFLNGPIFGRTTIFQKTSASGDTFWIDVTGDSAENLTFAAHDSSGRSATFGTLVGPFPSSGVLIFYNTSGGSTATGQTAWIDVFTTAGFAWSLVGTPSSASTGFPRWGVPGTVSLQCNLTETPVYDTCTSYDLNTEGDNLDPTYSTEHEHAWTMKQTCTAKGICSGSAGDTATCNASATSRQNQLKQQLSSSVPAPILNNLTVTGSYVRTGSAPAAGTCDLTIAFYPSPTTRSKPVCGLAPGDIVAPNGITYDELSLWNRPITGPEETLLAAAYGFTGTNESLPPPAPLPGAEQTDGLAPALLEAASAHVNLLAAYLDASRGTIYTECFQGAPSPTLSAVQAKVGPGLRLAFLLQGQAAQLAAVTGATSAVWFPRYQADQKDLAGKYQLLLAVLQEAQGCTNPLHISENEIPLYIGDASGLSANDRFFASTKALSALLENAQGELTIATSELEAARTAYIAQQQSEFQETQTDQANDDRINGINGLRTQYESQLRKFCGAPSSDTPPDESTAGAATPKTLLDGFLSGTLTADNCFLATEVPGCEHVGLSSVRQTPAKCLRGDMGARVIAIQTAAVDVQSARQAIDRSVDQWAADEQYCFDRKDTLDDITELQINHQQQLVNFHRDQASVDNTAGIISSVIDIGVLVVAGVATAGAADAAAALAGVAAGAGAGQNFISNVARSFTDSIDVSQAEEEALFEVMLTEQQEVLDLGDCFHKANSDVFAVEAAVSAMGRNVQETAAAAQALGDERGQVMAIAQEAQGQINRENTIDRTPPHLHYWLDDHIAAYTSHMKNARRLTYLAVRAFEYEAQLTSNQRLAVLTARTPADLVTVLDRLTADTAAFAGQLPNQGSPGQTPDVFSLRDDILDLGGLITAKAPPGRPSPVTKEQAFTTLLTSDSSKLFADDGTFLGHAIRFTLSGNSPWNQDTCAERIWRITPSVQVSGGGPTGPNATHLILYQVNTFGSQVCTDPTHPDVARGTVSLVRYQPVSNLLTGDDPVTFASPDSLSSISIDYTASLQPGQLQSAQQGDNPLGFASGFAGRGVLGNYILLFPACTNCTDTDGWTDHQLAGVTDVLLRFDVVSASNINNDTH